MGDEKKIEPKIEFAPLDVVVEPNQADFDAFQEKIAGDYKALQERMREVHRLIREKELEKQRALQEQNRMFSYLQQLDAEFQAKKKEREPTEQERLSLERALRREQDEFAQMRARCDYLDEEALDQAVAEKQHFLETNSLGVADERKLVKEITRLRASRPLIKEYRAKKEVVQRAQDALRGCEGHAHEKTRELERMTERLNRQKTAWEATKAKESSLDKEINRLKDEDVTRIAAEMKTMSDSLNHRREEFRRQKEAFAVYQAEVARRQRILEEEKARRQAEIRRKQAEDRKREQEKAWKEKQEEFEYVPWCDEMALCDTLVRYLERLLPQSSQVAAAAETPAAAASSPAEPAEKKDLPGALLDEDGRQLVVKKDDEEFFFKGSKGKKKDKKAQPPKPKMSESLSHAADIFTGFNSLQLQPPLLLADVASSIEALKAKKEYFKTAPPPSAEQQKRPPRAAPERQERPAPRHSGPFRADSVDWAPLAAAAAAPAASPAAAEGETPAPAPAAAPAAPAPKNTVWSKFSAQSAARGSLRSPAKISARS